MNERVVADLYIDLLKRCLTRALFPERARPVAPPRGGMKRILFGPALSLLERHGLRVVRAEPVDPHERDEGRDLPLDAETMVGLRRLDHLQRCVADVLERDVPGDLIECGVWRGGAAILMRAVLAALGDLERLVWVADSFRGLPRPDAARHPADAGDRHWTQTPLAVSLDEVRENFRRYGLLDERVRFLPGWFEDTLPSAPIERLSVLRVDADMYGSTIVALDALYPKLSAGGYVIVDDYGAVPACRIAVDEFRARHGVMDKLRTIDWTGVYWKRTR
jgi:O-methyltransferase